MSHVTYVKESCHCAEIRVIFVCIHIYIYIGVFILQCVAVGCSVLQYVAEQTSVRGI